MTDSPPPLLRDITENDKCVAFSFLSLLRELDTGDSEEVEIATNVLQHIFKVDAAGVGGSHDKQIDLAAVFAEAVKKKAGNEDPLKDEKFLSFLELLKKKGYFNNCEEGTEEYQSRVEKAFGKFQARNNLSADQLKQKGNELMSETKFQEAIGCYSKAIELDGTNHIYYANRAAAQTFLKDYRAAIIDCERAISLEPTYTKAYSRLGNALFHEKQYRRAVEVYKKAVEMDPSNESYKSDLKLAEEQMNAQAPVAPAGGGMPGMPGFPPGMMPPGMDMNAMNQMMSNPEFMKQAMQMMQNPAFANMMQGAAEHVRGSTPEEQMNSMMEYMQTQRDQQMAGGNGGVDADGNIVTPMGKIPAAKIKQMQEEEAAKNPKFRAVMEDVKVQGPAAFQKYMGDPEVMELITRFMGMMEPHDANSNAVEQ